MSISLFRRASETVALMLLLLAVLPLFISFKNHWPHDRHASLAASLMCFFGDTKIFFFLDTMVGFSTVLEALAAATTKRTPQTTLQILSQLVEVNNYH